MMVATICCSSPRIKRCPKLSKDSKPNFILSFTPANRDIVHFEIGCAGQYSFLIHLATALYIARKADHISCVCARRPFQGSCTGGGYENSMPSKTLSTGSAVSCSRFNHRQPPIWKSALSLREHGTVLILGFHPRKPFASKRRAKRWQE